MFVSILRTLKSSSVKSSNSEGKFGTPEANVNEWLVDQPIVDQPIIVIENTLLIPTECRLVASCTGYLDREKQTLSKSEQRP